ncbi:unnamed protein product [Brassicogethes aeneus]|uniref:Sortilin-related receptor n=1 Tax=Brassicogethes aeneus TaxID=1431903 RepID=A0A9P0BCW6_BRAAE|nr:unnamed protein product [Brassicogethes aeneus]
MNLIIFLLVFTRYFVVNGSAEIEKHIKTIHGNPDVNEGLQKTHVFTADLSDNDGAVQNRHKRAVNGVNDTKVITKIKHLNDTHKQLMVHWVGEGSNVIICLARDPAPFSLSFVVVPVSPSAVYISYDYGDTYENKTELFKLKNGTYATLEKFYNHPKFNTHFVFTDIRHNMLFVTKDHGKTFTRYELNFTPSDVSFCESDSDTFVALDKNNTEHQLYITENFGNHFRKIDEFVKSFSWLKDANARPLLVIQRNTPNGLSTILFSDNLFKSNKQQVHATNVKDYFQKGEYLFTTKDVSIGANKDTVGLYVSHKLGGEMQCIFDTDLPIKNYFIVDVTANRAMVAVSHNENLSNLYVSESLVGNNRKIKFTLSLDDVFAFFPNNTWQDTWLHHVSEDAFADVYRVDGLTGIYIASRVLSKPTANSLGPQHLGSVITFDHGRSWRPIVAPDFDVENQRTGCLVVNNCSLHLSQKFSQLNPDTRSISILTSKSAPGIIVATGVMGKSLKGHYGVYVSLDAGLTWRQTLRELFFFNMGDHGGIFAAVEYYKSYGETRYVQYSVDEGESWHDAPFHDEQLRMYGLMTEPGENTTIFTMFGSLSEQHQWIIIKLDFMKVFNTTCGEDDYKPWTPSQTEMGRSYMPCVMGQQMTYKRRIPHANCYNGQNAVGPLKVQPCDCDYLDFECDYGFKRTGTTPYRCIKNHAVADFDPFAVPTTCKPGQFYNRTKGYRHISGDACVDGFKDHFLPDLVPCPITEPDNFLLFAQREKISRLDLVTKSVEELPVKNLKNVITIDFDVRNNCVYWADIILDIIGRQCFKSGSQAEVLVSSDLASIEGMALDWISNTLYFVDGVRAKIEFIRTDINHSGRMRTTVLDSKVLKKPRGIALHPKNGYLFWTDWSADFPSVNRANLDGSQNKTLFGKNTVEWPNGITVDYIANRIYWVDAKLDYIGSSDLHGDGFIKVVSAEDVVSHPFAVAVFKNQMYWDDWKRNAIFSADKDVYKGVEVLVKPLPGLMDLKVYAHGIQFGNNSCTLDTTCRYTCVGLPKNKFTCLCPDGLVMKEGSCMCPGDIMPNANLTCPKVNTTCSPEHFTCSNDGCIPKGWRCDGEDDCGDNSDENQCGTNTCAKNYFVCGDGKCLPSYWKCDYEPDCSDGSDELNCPHENCTSAQFKCTNGRCISKKWVCDGQNDCGNGSDEVDCHPNPPSNSCKTDEFHCQSGGLTCIPSTWKCDGEPDCRDGSDEVNCNNNTCTEAQFSCGEPSFRCIYKSWICDGDKDCPDGRDELNCTTTRPQHQPYPFPQANGTCEEWMFKCANNRCVPFWWKCDDADDCGDGSDEEGCTRVNLSSTTVRPGSGPTSDDNRCGNNMFQCPTGQCIFSGWLCDGTKDCPEGEDELHCGEMRNCTREQFKCRVDGSCISQSLVCNNHQDCPDGSDESSCDHPQNLPGPATPSCSKGYFPCDGSSCYPLSLLCDNKQDCHDGYDERNCSNRSQRIYQVMQMGVNERGVSDSSLSIYWWIQRPSEIKLEFIPSISRVGDDKWENKTATDDTEYEFTNLEPYTKYNITIYVKIKNSGTVFPPAKHFIAHTVEGVPSEPWNVTAKQINGSHILLKWNAPKHPKGVITNYRVVWYQNDRFITDVRLRGSETKHLLPVDLEHGKVYNFYVIAINNKFESNKSIVGTLNYDGKTFLEAFKDLSVKDVTNHSVALAWKYDGEQPEGFLVKTFTERLYPALPYMKTTNNSLTINLAPGTTYHFEVYAFRNTLNGPSSFLTVKTKGFPLPQVANLEAILIKQTGTGVKLTWDRPKDGRKVKWNYGIFYGITEEELVSKTRLRTTEESAQITDLAACEIYMFSVAIVGPYGYGPLANLVIVRTSINILAPPERVSVSPEPYNKMAIRVTWEPSCPNQNNTPYLVEITELNSRYTHNKQISNLTGVFNIAMGGRYQIRVRTLQDKSKFSIPVYIDGPPIMAPYEVRVLPENNGSYIVYWQERQLPKEVGNYTYEILVCEGNVLNEKTAARFNASSPPFIYTNTSGDTYTFAARIKTHEGMLSMTSDHVSKRSEYAAAPVASNSTTVVVSVSVCLILVAVIGYLVARNRKLHSSFTRFANSHYDTRSQAATFDDNGLEDEDCPQIRDRFSDDEPLVIA